MAWYGTIIHTWILELVLSGNHCNYKLHVHVHSCIIHIEFGWFLSPVWQYQLFNTITLFYLFTMSRYIYAATVVAIDWVDRRTNLHTTNKFWWYDLLEIKNAKEVWKQQSRFNWDCSLTVMKDTTLSKPPTVELT